MSLTRAEIDYVILLRAAAKRVKEFAFADHVRVWLRDDAGIELEDLPNGDVRWRMV